MPGLPSNNLDTIWKPKNYFEQNCWLLLLQKSFLYNSLRFLFKLIFLIFHLILCPILTCLQISHTPLDIRSKQAIKNLYLAAHFLKINIYTFEKQFFFSCKFKYPREVRQAWSGRKSEAPLLGTARACSRTFGYEWLWIRVDFLCTHVHVYI